MVPEENGEVFQWLKSWEKPEGGIRQDQNPYHLEPMGEDVSNGTEVTWQTPKDQVGGNNAG